MANRKYTAILVIIVAVAMILSSAAFLFPNGSQTAASGTHTSNAQATAMSQSTALNSVATSQKGASILQALHSKGIPNKDIYLPNFNAATQRSGNETNGPSYTTAPAPMGIGTYGFSNNSGVITRNNISTSSFAGSVTFNNFNTFYAYDDGPNSVTVQLNSILSNVTLFGQSGYTFWNQNVLFYSARTHQVTFLDNIWNFSNNSTLISANVFASSDGNLIAPYYYYTVGPTFTVTYPFTVTLYLNSTVLDGNNAVFFNYTLSDASGAVSGSYDQVQFNSAPATHGNSPHSPTYSAPQANYLVTSYNVTPTGFIPYDSEIMIGGPGGGSTAMIYQINASMTLKYLNGGTYKNVPNAYDVGSETGETSTGASVTWTPNAVAHLSAGPSFVYGMWNVSQTNTFDHFSGTVHPPNSFMFVSPGSSFDAANSTWTPLTQTGSYSFSLPAGSYSTSILMADHTPVNSQLLTAGTSQTFTLLTNLDTGVYTPLYAFGNSQLYYISHWGDGSPIMPYVLYNNPSPSGLLNSLFTTYNDYFFPEFSGVLLHNTTAYVTVAGMPSFTVQYSPSQQAILAKYSGISYGTNQLGMVLYKAQNVSLESNHFSGWFSLDLSEFPVANLLLWNSQNDMIQYNTFNTMDSSLMIYNTQSQFGNNLVYRNHFLQDSTLNYTRYAGIAVSTTFGTSPYGPVAMTLYSSGNNITSNSVTVLNTAISPYYSIYSGYGAAYVNDWNGNFWWNYVPHGNSTNAYQGHYSPGVKNGFLYSNYGQIAIGGDYTPIVLPGWSPSIAYSLVYNVYFN